MLGTVLSAALHVDHRESNDDQDLLDNIFASKRVLISEEDLVPVEPYWPSDNEKWVGWQFVADFTRAVNEASRTKYKKFWRDLPEFALSREATGIPDVEMVMSGKVRVCGRGPGMGQSRYGGQSRYNPGRGPEPSSPNSNGSLMWYPLTLPNTL